MAVWRRVSIVVAAAIGISTLGAFAGQALGNSGFVVDIYDRERAYNGTTMFRIGSRPAGETIVEVDMEGQVVWRYPVAPKLYRGNTRRNNHVTDIELLPSGNVMFVVGKTAIYEIDRKGTGAWRSRRPDRSFCFRRGVSKIPLERLSGRDEHSGENS